MNTFRGRTADEVWRQVATQIRGGRNVLRQPSRAGDTRELLHSCLVLQRPRERWVVSREPAINPAFALAEVVWIVTGRKDSAFLNFWNPVLHRFAGDGPSYYGAYGERLRFRFGIDQIKAAYEALRSKPESRQVVLQIWDPAGDLPMQRGRPREADIPCNLCSLLKVRHGRLEWVQVMRSNDLILGLPHNIVQFTTLHELMASWLQCELGTYIHFSDSLHVYARNLRELRAVRPRRLPRNSDRWSLNYRRTAAAFAELSDKMDKLRQPNINETTARRLCTSTRLPNEAMNYLAIIGADAARRHHFDALSNELARSCTNPALRALWRRWSARQVDRHVKEHHSHGRQPS